ncbi:MAG: hypothetical protein PHI12_08395 [Dehalococcoidales bacterium]|nr:hypothetical protein [Dehalococcoidales bacterium]
MKKQTWADYFKGKSDQDLIQEATGLDQMINVVECFGTHDLLRFDAVRGELERRGYEAVQSISFRKRDEEEEE